MIPLSSFSEAKSAIENHRKAVESNDGSGNHAGAGADSDTSEDEIDHAEHVTSREREDDVPSPAKERVAASRGVNEDSSVARDVISKKGAYGRFTERWFSKNGWSVERRKNQGMSADASDPAKIREAIPEKGGSGADEKAPASPRTLKALKLPLERSPSIVATLVPKLLRTSRLLLNSQSFYFSYDHDITRRIGSPSGRGGDISLHKRVDPLVGNL